MDPRQHLRPLSSAAVTTQPGIPARDRAAALTLCRRYGHDWEERRTPGSTILRLACVHGCGTTTTAQEPA